MTDTGKATVQLGKRRSLNTVTSGSASGAIALNMGAKEIIVRVTAENGVTKGYTVTITREPLAGASGNANLSALIASTATSETGNYSAQTLTPAFDKATTA